MACVVLYNNYVCNCENDRNTVSQGKNEAQTKPTHVKPIKLWPVRNLSIDCLPCLLAIASQKRGRAGFASTGEVSCRKKSKLHFPASLSSHLPPSSLHFSHRDTLPASNNLALLIKSRISRRTSESPSPNPPGKGNCPARTLLQDGSDQRGQEPGSRQSHLRAHSYQGPWPVPSWQCR